MNTDEIKEMLKNIKSFHYKLNEETHTIEKKEMGGSSQYVKELVTIIEELNQTKTRYIIVGDQNIQIEK